MQPQTVEGSHPWIAGEEHDPSTNRGWYTTPTSKENLVDFQEPSTSSAWLGEEND